MGALPQKYHEYLQISALALLEQSSCCQHFTNRFDESHCCENSTTGIRYVLGNPLPEDNLTRAISLARLDIPQTTKRKEKKEGLKINVVE